jgi:hypothetical protein
MNQREERLRQFMGAYADRFNDALSGKEADTAAVTAAFASCFVEASPQGIRCSKNDEQFRKAIPEGYAFYKKIGTRKMKINGLNITLLDELHAMLQVHWHAIYDKRDGTGDVINFDVWYLVQDPIENIRIFAYITGDEQKVLKEHGLVPEG